MKRFTYTELDLEDGDALVLNANGSIDIVDADGNHENDWDTDDPEWANQARHFGLSRKDLAPEK